MPRLSKFSELLAVSMWVSVIALSWKLVLRLTPFDWISMFFWGFFLFVALVASAIATPKKVKSNPAVKDGEKQ